VSAVAKILTRRVSTVRRPARLERTQSCRSNWRETCWRVDHCRAGARGQRCLGYLAELKLWTTPKFLKCERYSATAVPVHPVWSLAIARSETSWHRPLSQAVVFGRTHPYQSRSLPSDVDALRRNDYAGGINKPSSTSCAGRLHRAFGCAHALTAEQSCSTR
jgi:hypothetical protein